MDEGYTIKMKVVGDRKLHCSGCERTVEFTLSRLPSVEAVKADHRAQTIEVNVNGDESVWEKIKAELAWIGYQVEAA